MSGASASSEWYGRSSTPAWGASARANPDLDADVSFTDLPPTPQALIPRRPDVTVLFALLFFVLAATYLAA